jgi:hypothetical protein
MANTIEHKIPKKIQGLVGKESGHDGAFFAIVGIEGTGETSYWPSYDDDGTELSPVGPKGLDYYLAHKREVKRMAVRLIVSGNAVSAESYAREATGCMASAIGPNTVDVFPDVSWTPLPERDTLKENASKAGKARAGKPAAVAASRANGSAPAKDGKKRGRPRKSE